MYYFYEISTHNDNDWVEKEYKTIEHIIFNVLKSIDNEQYEMYSYSVSKNDHNHYIYSADLKTNALFNDKKILLELSG